MTIARRSGVRVTGGGAESFIAEDAVLCRKISTFTTTTVTIEAESPGSG